MLNKISYIVYKISGIVYKISGIVYINIIAYRISLYQISYYT